MPMSSGGRVASSSACATRPKEEEIGLTGSAVPTQRSSLIGHYVMATAEHREPCDSRGSCTVLGAPGGEIPPGDSTKPAVPSTTEHSRSTFNCGRTVTLPKPSRGGRNPEPETGGCESASNRDRG